MNGLTAQRGAAVRPQGGIEAMVNGLPVVKMNGLGNAIAVIDLRGGEAPLTVAEAHALAAPSVGLGFDQIMALHPATDGADCFMRIYNADGSEAGACGNGTRCVADLLFAETGRDRLVLATEAGALVCTPGDAAHSVTVDMGAPQFAWDRIPLAGPVDDTRAVTVPLDAVPGAAVIRGAGLIGPASVANVGNPHAIFWVEDIDAIDFAALGPLLERHPLFPERVNVSLARVDGPDRITLKVWERGAGLTRACGTAACATMATAVRTGRTGHEATIVLPGGELRLAWRESDGHILMTGPAETEARGLIDRHSLTVRFEAPRAA